MHSFERIKGEGRKKGTGEIATQVMNGMWCHLPLDAGSNLSAHIFLRCTGKYKGWGRDAGYDE